MDEITGAEIRDIGEELDLSQTELGKALDVWILPANSNSNRLLSLKPTSGFGSKELSDAKPNLPPVSRLGFTRF